MTETLDESAGYIKGLQMALYIIEGSEGDIDFAKFKLLRHLNEYRGTLLNPQADSKEEL